MLTKQFPFLDPAAITIDLAERLHKLADDCAILAQYGTAPRSQLRTAPLLDRYLPVITSQGVRLIGHVSDHPVLGSRQVITSQLWFADPDRQWLRTLSRYYRLGAPASSNDDADEVLIVLGRASGPAFDH